MTESKKRRLEVMKSAQKPPVPEPQPKGRMATPTDVADAVWAALAVAFAPSKDMSDAEMLIDKMKQDRRRALREIVDATTWRDELELLIEAENEKLVELLARNKKEPDEKKHEDAAPIIQQIQGLQTQVKAKEKEMSAWMTRLDAVEKIEASGLVEQLTSK